jgi:N12 class adenine-specific DNA methylase
LSGVERVPASQQEDGVTYHRTESDFMAVSEKKRAAFASLIARQKEKRKNESLDGGTDSKSNNYGATSSHEAEAGPGTVGKDRGRAGDAVVRTDSTDRGSEQGNIAGSRGDRGGGQGHSRKGASGENRAGSARSGRVSTPQRSSLAPEERNFTIEPGFDPQPAGRKKRLEANLAAIKLLKTLELENRHATPEEKQILAKYNGFGADKEVFNSSMAQYRTFVHRDSYEFYAGRKVLVLKEGLDAETVYGRLQPVLNRLSRAEFASRFETGELVNYLCDNRGLSQHSLYLYLERELKEANPFSVKTEGGWEQIYGRWYDEFREIMSDEEWEAASRSSLNSHYTPAWMCHQIWGLAEKIGFKGGKVFEPGCGVGNFMGAMPESFREGSTVSGVELDPLSARMAAKLYPENQIELSGIEEALMVGDNTQDLVIGNVPFSDTPPSGQRGAVKLNLHNLCISKAIDKLRPGGVAILISSHSTLDNNDSQRQVLASKAELVAAVRLPNDAFMRNANTEVVADILVLRKPWGVGLGSEQWRQVEPLEVTEKEASENGNRLVNINEYFHQHPEMMLGEPSLRGKMYGADPRGQFTVQPRPGRTLDERLAEAFGRIPENLLAPVNVLKAVEDFLPRAHTSLDIGSFVEEEVQERDGTLRRGIYMIGASEGSQEKVYLPPPWRDAGALARGASVEELEQMGRAFIGLRTGLEALITHDVSTEGGEEASAQLRSSLRKQYDAFVLRFGPLNTNRLLKRYFSEDPALGSLMALENTRLERAADGTRRVVCEPAAILAQRTVYPVVPPSRTESLEDAIYVSLAFRGTIDVAYVGLLIGQESMDPDVIKRRIIASGLAFENPETGILERREQYLSGNVFDKLAEAQARVEASPQYEVNVKALEEVLPPRVPFNLINADCGAPWVGEKIVQSFLAEITGAGSASYIKKVAYIPAMRRWVLPDEKRWYISRDCEANYATRRVSALDVIEAALNDKRLVVKDKIDERYFVNREASEAANHRVALLKEKWADWLGASEERRKEVEKAYNDTFNRVVTPSYNGDHLKFPGLANGAGALIPRTHQRGAVARFLTEQQGVVAHNVGFGKTLTSIITAMESKRVGIAKKPMIVCYNANYADFVDTIRKTYPGARILVTEEHHMQEKNRHAFLSRIATGNWDVVVMAQSQFDRIPLSPETEARYLRGRVMELRGALESVKLADGDKVTVRSLEKSLERAEARLKDDLARMRENADKTTMTFESLGIDLLIVDEAHEYKNLPVITNYRNVRGLNQSPSDRAKRMLQKVELIQARRGGKGVMFLTGTPIKNQVIEAYNMLLLTSPKTLESFGIDHLDTFIRTFCRREVSLELNEANGKWREVERLKKYHNGPELIRMIRTGFDVQMDVSRVQIDVPKVKGGGPELVKVPLSDTVADILEELSDCYAKYEQTSNKRELSWVPITLMQFGVAASIDPRLVDGHAPDEPGSLVNRLVREAKTIYDETSATRAVQTIFCDRYRTMDASILKTMVKVGIEKAGERMEIEDGDALGKEKSAGASGDEEEEKDPADEQVAVGHFNLYHDIRDKLVTLGVPKEEISIVNEAKNAAERQKIFEAANESRVRFVIGSRQKQGVGANYQRNLLVAHHLDPARDMTPASMVQANGRIVRQGNRHEQVQIKYYGMQDTMVPGIFHRLQTKQHFIAQVLSGSGIGAEFEEAGTLQLEEMRNGLISDKRALVHTDLKLAIKEAKMRNHLLFDRNKQVENEIRNLETEIAVLKDHKLVQAKETARWCADSMQILDAYDTDMEIAYSYPGGEAGQKPLKAIEKDLRDLIANWRRQEIPLSRDSIELGTLELNHLKMDIEKRYVSLAGKETWLIANVKHPLLADRIMSQSKFLTPDAICKIVRTRYEEMLAEPAALEVAIKEKEASRERLVVERTRLEQPDYDAVKKLEQKLAALEQDMRDNPYQRRGRRGQQPATVHIEVEGVKVRQETQSGHGHGKTAAGKGRRMVDEGTTEQEDQINVQISRARTR